MSTQITIPRTSFSSDDINLLFLPPRRQLSAIEVFETSRTRLANAKLAPIDMFDRFADRLPADGIPFLPRPPQPRAIREMDWTDYMARPAQRQDGPEFFECRLVV